MPAPKYAIDLLMQNIEYDGWEHQIGNQRAFIVRGFTWFFNCLASNGNNRRAANFEDKKYIDRMQKILESRDEWINLPFPWNEDFSPRQAMYASSAKSNPSKRFLSFYKAVQTIVLCEAIIEDIKNTTLDVYENMRIQPSLSYIHEFEQKHLDVLNKNKQFDELIEITGQKTRSVFNEMAQGHSVTEVLAVAVHQFFRDKHPEISIGSVDFRPNARMKNKTSTYEDFHIEQYSYMVEISKRIASRN